MLLIKSVLTCQTINTEVAMNKKFKEIYEKARLFIYRNARPIELALWEEYF